MYFQRATSARICTVALAVVLAVALGGSRSIPFSYADAAGSCNSTRTSLVPDGVEAELIARINTYRTQVGAPALTVSPALMASAVWKSADLATRAYFAHDDAGRTWTQRIVDCGYTGTPNVAENLAAGYEDAASTFDQWRSSPGHNANMVNSTMKVIGLARAYAAGSPYGWYWTANFGTATDVPAPSPAAPPASPPPAASAPTVGTAPNTAMRIAVYPNATAVVTGTGDCLRIHESPSLSSPVHDCLADGSAMVVVAGPVSADGFVWWQLGALGWAVDQYLVAAQVGPGQ